MRIPTEPIGSIPRPPQLIEAVRAFHERRLGKAQLDELYDEALRDTIQRFEQTGSPVIADGEQTKPSFLTYAIEGLEDLAPEGTAIRFADGHVRWVPVLTSGPFRYRVRAVQYLEQAKRYAKTPVKQAVISASALSLIYPEKGIRGYSREEFLGDLVNEAEADIRLCLERGAYDVQIDFTEGRLAVKLDPSKKLLASFIDINNRVLRRFTEEERRRIGVHTCPGGDRDTTHSADVDYADLLPSLFDLEASSFFMQLASEKDRTRVLRIVRENLRPGQRVFVGVIDPLDPTVETPEQVRDRVLEAAGIIPVDRLGTTDDCGFSPFGDDTSTSRDVAFAKIRARVVGTDLAADALHTRGR